MNFKGITSRLISSEEKLSTAEVLYTLARELKIEKISDFLNHSDEDIYSAMEKALEFEKE